MALSPRIEIRQNQTLVMTPPEIKRAFAARAKAVTSLDGDGRLSINATTSTPALASVLTVEAA